MKLLVALVALLVVFMIIIFVAGIIIFISKAMDRSINKEINGCRRNYKVRFNPSNNKYYITNASSYGDIDVLRYGMFRIYYKSKIDADFVMQKLNDPS